ncbi:transcription repressor OFP7-like [Zingiber officinale]|uniref:Transcription repressor n=1 Tax=Zingiber officinale TaxID=94328 RepID=A0A8J5C4F2_ZINOF|nr:transcription repressor OFP7-like [Zingiber officinale]KAG6470833.1 hypothetical protein ZIOFF_071913 [Zingiber officinale]
MRVRPAYAQRKRKEAKFCGVVPCGGLADVEVKSSLLPSSARRSGGRRRDVPILHQGTRSSTDEDDSGWWSGDDAIERLTRKPIPWAPLAVRGSLAVVKQSEDPRLDFLRSMAEMVVEKQIVSSKGLEQLLQCFMSLNSREHHAAILAAFEDIWQALFPAVPGR